MPFPLRPYGVGAGGGGRGGTPSEHNLGDHIDVNTPDPQPNEALTWDFDTQNWIPKRSTSALGFVRFEYRMTQPVNITPAIGRVSRNTEDPLTATILYFNRQQLGGSDVGVAVSR